MAHPLTSEHLKSINEALVSLKSSQEVIQRAIQAGLPLEDAAKEANDLSSKLLGIKRAFFPEK